MSPLTPETAALLCLVLCIVAAQGVWIFHDARRRGIFPWFWGLWGLIHAPLPIIVYYFVVIRKEKKHAEHPESDQDL